MKEDAWKEMLRLKTLIEEDGRKKIIKFTKISGIIKIFKSVLIISIVIEVIKKLIIGLPNLDIIIFFLVFLGSLNSLDNYIKKCIINYDSKMNKKLDELLESAAQDLNLKEVENLKQYYPN